MKDNLTLNLSITLFRALLTLYPRSFRQRFGSEMTQVFQDSSRAALTNGGSRQMAVLWMTAFLDLIATAFVERITEEYHMSVSSSGRVAGLLGAIGGAIWLVGVLFLIFTSDDPSAYQQWIAVVALVMMTIGVIGLYLRSGWGSAGGVIIALLFLGYLLMTVGLSLLAMSPDDSGNGWTLSLMSLLMTMTCGAAFGIYASRQRWGRPWTLILAVIGVVNFVVTIPLAFGLGGAEIGSTNTFSSALEFAFFGSIGLYALILGLLTMSSERQESPPALPAV